ncbi:uncharacterized protein [Alexandromys fortis]|uniref:uncharacterized protein n=1 Tax=Alexandromys fortis TaxID=100897 RepID=UPI002152A48A|nr:uncharacterized protein LOC126488265 [Microtus fortis]
MSVLDTKDNSKPGSSCQEMRESQSTGEPGQEVQAQQRQSPARGYRGSHRPTQPSAPLADPAPFRPADPAVPGLVTQFLFCQEGSVTISRPDPNRWTPSTYPEAGDSGGRALSAALSGAKHPSSSEPPRPPPPRFLRHQAPAAAVAAAAAAAPAPCAPRLRDELSARASAQAPGRVFPTRKEATIEKSREREGTYVLTSAIVLGAEL